MLKHIYAQPRRRYALFLDRDGVVNERDAAGYVLRWDDFVFKAGVFQALLEVASRELPIVVLSNQSCVAHGLITPKGVS